jgi:D-arginine dehydrogenase
MTTAQIAIIGAGIAGASLAAALGKAGGVILIEAEDFPGYHTTGRSAALFNEAYGNAVIRGLTRASRACFEAAPLLTPRGTLVIARPDQAASLAAGHEEAPGGLELWSAAAARAAVPVLRAEAVAAALYDPHAMDIDVHTLHQRFLVQAKAEGARLLTSARVEAIERRGGKWRIETAAGAVEAAILVNAAGAWADAIAALAGAKPIGLEPRRRTALLIDLPAGCDAAAWPMVIGADEEFYFKPDAGRLLVSPCDETLSPPCDARPEELDIAIAIDRLQCAADLPVRRVFRSWAGLRSFVADRSPVVGWDPDVPDLFWLAAQGGYGIQTAPALSQLAAALCRGGDVPAAIAAESVTEAALSPARLPRKIVP